jgi:superfamily II RNA helicase
MVELYLSGTLAKASPAEIVATLSSMLDAERGVEVTDAMVFPNPEAASVLQRTAKKGQDIERRHGVDPVVSWDLTPFWPTLVTAWMEGRDAGSLTSTYGIYEGNLMRALLKCTNLVNEWVAMATFCGDVDMLETLKDVPILLLRDIAQPESLYLHL